MSATHPHWRPLGGCARSWLALPLSGRVRVGAHGGGLPPRQGLEWDILDDGAYDRFCGHVSAGVFHDLLICLPTSTWAAWQRAEASRGTSFRTRQSPQDREGVSIRGRPRRIHASAVLARCLKLFWRMASTHGSGRMTRSAGVHRGRPWESRLWRHTLRGVSLRQAQLTISDGRSPMGSMGLFTLGRTARCPPGRT